MIDKLRNIFPSLTSIEEADKEKLSDYRWFQTDKEERFGIPKEDLSAREDKILKTLINPIELEAAPMTALEKEWSEFLFHGKMSDRLKKEAALPFRFLFFTLKNPAIDPASFKEAIHGFFPEPVPVLWENNQKGVIIEVLEEKNELYFYFDIAEVLMSDFYINLNLSLGAPVHDIEMASKEYNWLKKWSAVARNYLTKQIIDYREVTPYMFIDQLDAEYKQPIIDMVLKETQHNQELLQTIETFLACNSNATLAAKELYMHRNSLQYRVDKFIEQTGIDVKQFEGAITVYLTLGLLKNS